MEPLNFRRGSPAENQITCSAGVNPRRGVSLPVVRPRREHLAGPDEDVISLKANGLEHLVASRPYIHLQLQFSARAQSSIVLLHRVLAPESQKNGSTLAVSEGKSGMMERKLRGSEPVWFGLVWFGLVWFGLVSGMHMCACWLFARLCISVPHTSTILRSDGLSSFFFISSAGPPPPARPLMYFTQLFGNGKMSERQKIDRGCTNFSCSLDDVLPMRTLSS
jgi:hypothetical protein